MGHSGTEPPNDILSATTVCSVNTSSATNWNDDRSPQFTFYHPISGTDLTSGLDLTILITASSDATSINASYGNRQVVFQVIQ